MGAFRVLGLFALVPVAVLLTISFFVLLVLRKIEDSGLRIFGYVVATLLWIAAALVFMVGVYTFSSGQAPMGCMMSQMMGQKMPVMMGRTPEGMMPPMHQGMRNQTDMPNMPR